MPRTAERRETISTYLAPAEAARLREHAAAADRSISAEIRRALRSYLNAARPAGDRARVTTSAEQGRRAAG